VHGDDARNESEALMIITPTAFASYFAAVRRRTMMYIRAVPPDQVDWAPQAGEFTCGDLIRHVAAAEAMFLGVVAEGRWRYAGHAASPDDTVERLVARLEADHAQALQALRALPEGVLQEPRPSLEGAPVPTTWQERPAWQGYGGWGRPEATGSDSSLRNPWDHAERACAACARPQPWSAPSGGPARARTSGGAPHRSRPGGCSAW
jgi:uncharacterized damage-inducible protein DinB